MREITVFLISNIRRPISARKLTGLYGISAPSTVTEYLSHLKNAYIVDFIPMFDYSLKTQNRNLKKVYAIDLGIYHQVKTTFTEDFGRQLENAIFLHLRRKHKEIFYFNKNGECDFVLTEKSQAIKCVQVCYHVDDMNIKKEINGLKAALDFF